MRPYPGVEDVEASLGNEVGEAHLVGYGGVWKGNREGDRDGVLLWDDSKRCSKGGEEARGKVTNSPR